MWIAAIEALARLEEGPAAVGLMIVMPVAIATVHWRRGVFLNWSLEPGTGAASR